MVVECEVLWRLSLVEADLDQLSHFGSAACQAVPCENLEVSIHMSELLEVIDVVLVSFDIEPQIHPCKLTKLAHVDVVAKIVTAEVSLLLSVLLDTLEELIELLPSLEDVDLLRLDLFSLSFFKILDCNTSLLTEVSKCLRLQSLSLLYLHHVFLELLAEVQVTVVALRTGFAIVLHRVLLLWLIVKGS